MHGITGEERDASLPVLGKREGAIYIYCCIEI